MRCADESSANRVSRHHTTHTRDIEVEHTEANIEKERSCGSAAVAAAVSPTSTSSIAAAAVALRLFQLAIHAGY